MKIYGIVCISYPYGQWELHNPVRIMLGPVAVEGGVPNNMYIYSI